MRILVVGNDINFQETILKFGEHHAYLHVQGHHEAEKFLDSHDLVIDFMIDEEPELFAMYAQRSITVLLNTCRISLHELVYSVGNNLICRIFGFNGMPTFFTRPVLEASIFKADDEPALKSLCESLNTEFLLVDDRVGLFTPRVICMIINEAYYTEQEGTATREDIDMAMKLGTNYPYGPFEWCQRIGVRQVYKLLEAVYEDTKDERYKICPALKKEFLRA